MDNTTNNNNNSEDEGTPPVSPEKKEENNNTEPEKSGEKVTIIDQISGADGKENEKKDEIDGDAREPSSLKKGVMTDSGGGDATIQSYEEISVLSCDDEDDTVDKSQCLFDMISYDDDDDNDESYSEETIKDGNDDDGNSVDDIIEEITIDSNDILDDEEFIVEEEIVVDDKSRSEFSIKESNSSKTIDQQEDLETSTHAVKKVQAVARGFLVRNESKRRVSEVEWVASLFEGQFLSVDAGGEEETDENNEAAMIQAVARGYLVRTTSKRKVSEVDWLLNTFSTFAADGHNHAGHSADDCSNKSEQEPVLGIKRRIISSSGAGAASVGSLTTDSKSQNNNSASDSTQNSAKKFPPAEILLPSTFDSPPIEAKTSFPKKNPSTTTKKRTGTPCRSDSFQKMNRPPTNLQSNSKASVFALRQAAARRDLERRESMKIQAVARGYLWRRKHRSGGCGPSPSSTAAKESNMDTQAQFKSNHREQADKTMAIRNVHDPSKTSSTVAAPTNRQEPISSIKDKIKDLQRRSSANPKPLWNTTSRRAQKLGPSLSNDVIVSNKSVTVNKIKHVSNDLNKNSNEPKKQDEITALPSVGSVDSNDGAHVKERTDSVDTITSVKPEPTIAPARPPLSPMMSTGNRSRNNTWNSNKTPQSPIRTGRPPVPRSPPAASPRTGTHITARSSSHVTPPSPTSPRTELEGTKLKLGQQRPSSSTNTKVVSIPKRNNSQRSNTTAATVSSKEDSSSYCSDSSSLSKSNHSDSNNKSSIATDDDPFDDDMTVKSVKKTIVEMNETSPYYRESIAPLYQSWHSFDFSKNGKMRAPRKKEIPVRRYSCPTKKNSIQVKVEKQDESKTALPTVSGTKKSNNAESHNRGGSSKVSSKQHEAMGSQHKKQVPRNRVAANIAKTNQKKKRWNSFSSGVPIDLPSSSKSNEIEDKPMSIQERIKLFQKQ